MQVLAILLLLYLFLALVVFPIWAITRLNELGDTTRSLRSRLGDLKDEILSLRAALNRRAAEPVEEKPIEPLSAVPAQAAVATPEPAVVAPPPPIPEELPAEEIAPEEIVPEELVPAFEVFPAPASMTAEPTVIPPEAVEAAPPPIIPPVPQPEPVVRPVYVPPPPQPSWFDNINWEQFMGAKLFAWLGGLALFLGIAFFVKYSFDHDLIPPAVRVAIGFVVGTGLVVGGLKISREKYAITSQTLIGAGIVSLYAVTFACRSIYHFEFFGPVPTFLLMSLITATAFVLAVRLNAQVIAILGILGGFLTPKLLATGVDNPVGLFGYLAILNLGLIAVSLHRRWFYLVPLGASGTVLTMIAWANLFFAPEKTVTAMTVCLGFTALFIGAAEAARRLDRSSPLVSRTALALPAVAFCFAWYFLDYPAVAARTGLFFSYVTLISLGIFFLAWRERLGELVAVTAGISAVLMVRWAAQGAMLATPVIMTVCLAFCGLYFGVYLLARRFERGSPAVGWSAIGLPALALGFAWWLLDRPEAVHNPVLFFGFVVLVSLFIFALAWFEGAGRLVAGVAGATILLMIRWAVQGSAVATPVIMTVCLAFCAIYFVVYLIAGRSQRASAPVSWAAIGLPVLALGFAWCLLDRPEAAHNPSLFFGFVIVSSLFLFALAWFEGLGRLIAGAAGATVLLMIRWSALTFRPEQAPVIVTVCLVFCAIYFAVYLVARWLGRATPAVLGAAAALPFVALGFALALMGQASVGLLFGFILAADLLLLMLAWLDERLPHLHLVAGLVVFGLLSVWTAGHLTDALLPWALAMYLIFAALHTVFPLLLERKYPAAKPTWWSQLFPPLALLLMLLPIVKLGSVSFLIWPAILLVDLLAIGLAALTASLVTVGAVLVLTLIATGACLFRLPVTGGFDLSLLLVIGGFAVLFFAASLWLMRRIGDKLPAASGKASALFGGPRAQLPAFASLLPFLLLIMACARLTVADPSAVFGLGLLLVVLTLGLARLLVIEWLPACALAGMAALELVWHTNHFDAATAGLPLVWYVSFYAVFAAYPFIFRREFARFTGPWCIAALSGVAHFWMTYQTVKAGWPGVQPVLGLVPALFALAPLGSLVAVLRQVPADNPKRLNQLAWFGGVALFFITLIFPIQFERQWLTVAWALEGAALLWLFHRVPHRGLRATGVVLLVTAFVRLALNPAVLGYHTRGETGILNWYLYAYGLATAALFTGARLLAPPRERVFGVNTPPLLNTLATILAFLLLNIEIADFFTPPGARSLALQFDANLPRDMSYTIGWALFALGLLIAGIWKQTKAARYAAIALLSVSLLKLFFHDLARLEALYRIGALLGVAVIAILASFAYQRFLPGNDQSSPPTA